LEREGSGYVRRFLRGDVLHVQLAAYGWGGGGSDVSVWVRDAAGAPLRQAEVSVRSRGGYRVLDVVLTGATTPELLGGERHLSVELHGEGQTIALQSEPFCVVGDLQERSVLVEVSNSASAFGAYFDTVATPFAYRVEGGFYPKSLTPASSDTIFEAQQAQLSMLYSMPYETSRLVLGGVRGIPDGFIAKLNRALSCDALWLDGVPYGKTEGAKLEASEAERHPLRSWSIAVKEKGDPFVRSYGGVAAGEVDSGNYAIRYGDYVPMVNIL
jgi:hypothetical protein